MNFDKCPICSSELIIQRVAQNYGRSFDSIRSLRCSKLNLVENSQGYFVNLNCFYAFVDQNSNGNDTFLIERELYLNGKIIKITYGYPAHWPGPGSHDSISVSHNSIPLEKEIAKELIFMPEEKLISKIPTILTFS